MKKRIIILWLLLLFLASPGIDAAEEDVLSLEQQTPKLEASLSEESLDILEDFSPADGDNPAEGLEKLGSFLKENLLSFVLEAWKGAAVCLLIGLLLPAVSAAFPEGKQAKTVESVCLLAAAVTVAPAVSEFSEMALQALDALHTFSAALLPTLTAAAVGSGAATSAVAKYSVTALCMDVFLTASENCLVPVIYGLLAVSFAGAVFPNSGLEVLRRFLKGTVITVLTSAILGFLLYLSLTGVVTASTDAVATRLTKTVMSTALPVVGSILSDAAGTVVSSIGILKSTLGTFGVIALLAVCLVPFLRLSLRYLAMKMAAGLSGDRFGKFLSALGDVFGLLLGLVSTGGIMVLISIISLMKVVTAT